MNWPWYGWLLVAAAGLFGMIVLMNILNWCLAMMTGGAPIPRWWSYCQHCGKRLKGGQAVSWELSCPNGYLGYRVRYSDGSTVDFREAPRFLRNIPRSPEG